MAIHLDPSQPASQSYPEKSSSAQPLAKPIAISDDMCSLANTDDTPMATGLFAWLGTKINDLFQSLLSCFGSSREVVLEESSIVTNTSVGLALEVAEKSAASLQSTESCMGSNNSTRLGFEEDLPNLRESPESSTELEEEGEKSAALFEPRESTGSGIEIEVEEKSTASLEQRIEKGAAIITRHFSDEFFTNLRIDRSVVLIFINYNSSVSFQFSPFSDGVEKIKQAALDKLRGLLSNELNTACEDGKLKIKTWVLIKRQVSHLFEYRKLKSSLQFPNGEKPKESSMSAKKFDKHTVYRCLENVKKFDKFPHEELVAFLNSNKIASLN